MFYTLFDEIDKKVVFEKVVSDQIDFMLIFLLEFNPTK